LDIASLYTIGDINLPEPLASLVAPHSPAAFALLQLRAATQTIITEVPDNGSLASKVARTGVFPSGTQASHSAFTSAYDAMRARYTCAERILVYMLGGSAAATGWMGRDRIHQTAASPIAIRDVSIARDKCL